MLRCAGGTQVHSGSVQPGGFPKKSWEGIIGSYIITLVVGYFLFEWIVGPVEKDLPLYEYIIAGSILFVLAVTGDLAGSLIKRGLAVKDSGSLLPGIGGIFDLIDSPHSRYLSVSASARCWVRLSEASSTDA